MGQLPREKPNLQGQAYCLPPAQNYERSAGGTSVLLERKTQGHISQGTIPSGPWPHWVHSASRKLRRVLPG